MAFIAWKVAALKWGDRTGAVSGVVAALVFSLDPFFLGHGILVKNDVAIALTFLWTAYATYLVCRRVSVGSVTLLSLAVAAGVTIKFTGVAIAGIAFILLFLRAGFVRGDWRMGRNGAQNARVRGAGSVVGKIAVASGVCLIVSVVSYGAVWSVYGFRFGPSPTGEHFDMSATVERMAKSELLAVASSLRPGEDPNPTPEEVRSWQPGVVIRTLVWCYIRHLLPESYIAGFLYTYGSTLYRPAYLFGHYSDTGWRYYFAAAWLVKTPLTLIALTLTGLTFALSRRRWRRELWLVLPVTLYCVMASQGRLNIGLRHMSPVFPLLGLGIALLAGWVVTHWPGRRAFSTILLATALLAFEVLPHRLQYIQFFNLAAGGSRGGLTLLGDSNLDWAQDLWRLVEWQKNHPDTRLYLNYFGPAPPASLGLRYTNTNGSWAPGQGQPITPPGVYAVSATHLQGTYFYKDLRQEMARWRDREPIAVLGGTIYLFEVK